MSQVVLKINEEELTNGDLRFTSQISFKTGAVSVKYDGETPSFEMPENEDLTVFVEKIEGLKADAMALGELVKNDEAEAIQKEARKMFRKDAKNTSKSNKVSIFKKR